MNGPDDPHTGEFSEYGRSPRWGLGATLAVGLVVSLMIWGLTILWLLREIGLL